MSKKMSLLLSMAMLMTTVSGVNISADFSIPEKVKPMTMEQVKAINDWHPLVKYSPNKEPESSNQYFEQNRDNPARAGYTHEFYLPEGVPNPDQVDLFEGTASTLPDAQKQYILNTIGVTGNEEEVGKYFKQFLVDWTKYDHTEGSRERQNEINSIRKKESFEEQLKTLKNNLNNIKGWETSDPTRYEKNKNRIPGLEKKISEYEEILRDYDAYYKKEVERINKKYEDSAKEYIEKAKEDAKPALEALDKIGPLFTYADMSINGESKNVAEIASDDLTKVGLDDKINLDKHFDLYSMYTHADDGNGYGYGTVNGNKVSFRNEIIAVVTLPENIDIPDKDLDKNISSKNTNYKVTSVKKAGRKLTIKLKSLIENKYFKDYKKDDIPKLKNTDLNIKGLTFNDKTRLGEKYTITETVGGYGLFAYGQEAPAYSAFAARQSSDGVDIASSSSNVISLTLKLKSNTVTFKVDGQPDKPVLVETGKSINGDIDNTQSMPSDPIKSGYTFKGWFTQPNGGGTRFDGNTPVNSDITVYAYFERTPSNPGGGGGGGTTPDPGRVDGDDRVETGIKISQKYYDKAKTVIVVRHDLFPDSMTASVLAKLKDAPILLNPTNKLDPRVGAEIKRLGAEEVIIVGGPDSISEKVRGDLKAYDKDKDVERIAGVDRYGTSEMVARRVTGITGKKNTGVIASGQVFPDALSVGTFASRDGYPILLVKKNLVPDQVVSAIKDLDIKKTYIAGGTNTISKSTEAKLPGVLERMAGKDRYETSVAIAKSKFKDSTEAFIASGEEFADALVISPVSGKYNRPTLLASRNKKTNAVVKKYIEESYLTSITAIGGEKYLPNSIMLDLVGK
ncbi:MAG: cell wall-binding repeat-containing protein [Peptostreptococcus stomatis]|uniref:cell wall-binding repeat-containing protein n=1 Tax=Peptostreptococcus stomatis TaxID=341694 RepID=UPI001A582610|nr:cell wall-binding repeat-containing protein [Peptostreptococcus stomatis]MBL6466135.1 cell wall-binding repeat-containing protein [Peptostreptococcus stomatis]